jgi:NAD(P)-dependent dehydrogenase (short-subunit alcohol dehydrogenase family)
MANLRRATGAGDDDARLVGVRLDLTDSASIDEAAAAIGATVGAPFGLVHNAGISAAGMVEETPVDLWERMFATNIFGPVVITDAGTTDCRDLAGPYAPHHRTMDKRGVSR